MTTPKTTPKRLRDGLVDGWVEMVDRAPNATETTISRRELYERLWVEPKRDVARSFGVTSDRLSRLCRRNNIPIPVQVSGTGGRKTGLH